VIWVEYLTVWFGWNRLRYDLGGIDYGTIWVEWIMIWLTC